MMLQEDAEGQGLRLHKSLCWLQWSCIYLKAKSGDILFLPCSPSIHPALTQFPLWLLASSLTLLPQFPHAENGTNNPTIVL